MDEMRVLVCYATPDQQIVRELSVPGGATLRTAIEQSGVLSETSEINLATCRVGVFGKLKALDSILRPDDRIEIHRPLIADPKESRRKRAVKKDENKAR